MKTYKARDLAQYTNDQLWDLPEGPMTLTFDDGKVVTDNRTTIFSAYMFAPFYRNYPFMTALTRHHMSGSRLKSDTSIKILGRLLWDCYYESGQTANLEQLSKLVYDITNDIYNDFTYRLESYVTSVSILDFLEVIDEPQIAKLNANVEPTQNSVNETYRGIRKVLGDPEVLSTNPIAKAVRSGLVSIGQVLQCVGPRGLCTDIDSNIFREPILVGYVQGIRSLADSMKESRSASKSMMFTKDPLQESQYFNRKMQLLTGTFMRVHRGDCGTPITMPFRVMTKDLSLLAGKYYLTEESLATGGPLQSLHEEDKHLIDKVIHLRTIFGCQHPDPQGKCQTCYGSLALSIPEGTNVGHVAATMLCEIVSQKLLSVKHEDGSASTDGLLLSDFEKHYLEESEDSNIIRFSDNLDDCKIILTIDSKEADHLNDIHFVNDVRDLPVGLVSNLSYIQMRIVSDKGDETVPLQVSDGSRKSSMAHDLLAHIKEHGWSLNSDGNYVIDMTGWNPANALLELPLKQINMLDYMNTLERFIKASDKGKNVQTLQNFETTDAALRHFYELVSYKLNVNIAHLEVIVYTVMIRSSANKDYRLPHAGNAVEFGPYNDIMGMRSASAAMAYERHANVLLNPLSFITDNRPDHVLDAMLGG